MQNSLPIQQSNWQLYTIDQLKANKPHALAMGPFGSDIKTDNFVEEGVPIIRGGNLTQGKLNLNGFVYLTEEKADQLKASNAFPGDLVFTHRGTLGQVGLVPEKPYPRYVVSQSQMKLSVNKDLVDPLFIYYYFKGIGNRELLKHVAGAGVPAIANPLTTLKKLELLLPSLPTQKQIASILSAFDDKIEVNNKIAKTLEEMAQAIFKEWFVNFRFPGYEKVKFVDSELGEIPEICKVTNVYNLASYINRGIAPKYDDNSFDIVINQKCIRDKKLSVEFARTHSSKVPLEKTLRFGDILINSTGVGTLGRVTQVYISPENYTVDSHVTIVRPKDKLLIDYLGLFLLGQQKTFEGLSTGSSGQTELGRDKIASVKLLLPDENLLTEFSELISPLRKQLVTLMEENKKLVAMSDLLLPKLMKGEIHV